MSGWAQDDYGVRLDWGPVGAAITRADVAVVVDVLSFTTSVSVAVERGMRVFPFPWRDERAAAYAEERDAALAVGRLEASRDGAPPLPTLSPAGLRTCPPVPRLVLPSPNGSSIAAALAGSGAVVAAGCLRNSSAVTAWLSAHLAAGRSVVVVAAGERWSSDDSLRPCLEDHLGAGAILSGLPASDQSPEARAAAALFDATHDLGRTLAECVGGRELSAKGFGEDVSVAAALDVTRMVPVLGADGAFTPAPGRSA